MNMSTRDEKGRFKKGVVSYRPPKGSHHSPDTEFKKGVVNYKPPKGSHHSPETEFKKGHKMSDETRKKISETMKGKSKPWQVGKKIPQKTKDKMSVAHKGDKHWNWKGGIKTKKEDQWMNSAEGKEWRTAVFKRDDYTCQNPNCSHCNNKRGGDLQAHHIKLKCHYPELTFVISNGVTYCKTYHQKGGLHKRSEHKISKGENR